MTKKELFISLNELYKELDNKYNINNGGCCFVAACLAEQLDKHHIPYFVVTCFAPTHYLIKTSYGYINRGGFNKEEIHSWDYQHLYNLYYNEDWNSYYNRRWNLIVKTKIKSLFLKYENSRT